MNDYYPLDEQETELGTTIAQNLRRLRQEISQTASAAGRNPRDIKLIAVSKTRSQEYITAAVRAGQVRFGENTVQEALRKLPYFKHQKLEWHFIGHLQSNKTKFIPGNFEWVHTIHNASIVAKLNQAAMAHQTVIKILIQVNLTGDQHKHGIYPDNVFGLLEELLTAAYPNISLHGLMTIGPYPANESEVRRCFSHLRQLRDQCAEHFSLKNFTELSMGMSEDYKAAIAEGATFLRIGNEVFGVRDYSAKK